eukprot:TRINITY_DN5815_c0_g1_i2.p1 TRINITY_DN5815_c0_g1~~TRINITY_DN5815_c0_g1_i2.p1  ORF type:complete len:536 (-),score=163.94 TRINITY_DN5815_c0_g1_i2:159-1766(-)
MDYFWDALAFVCCQTRDGPEEQQKQANTTGFRTEGPKQDPGDEAEAVADQGSEAQAAHAHSRDSTGGTAVRPGEEDALSVDGDAAARRQGVATRAGSLAKTTAESPAPRVGKADGARSDGLYSIVLSAAAEEATTAATTAQAGRSNSISSDSSVATSATGELVCYGGRLVRRPAKPKGPAAVGKEVQYRQIINKWLKVSMQNAAAKASWKDDDDDDDEEHLQTHAIPAIFVSKITALAAGRREKQDPERQQPVVVLSAAEPVRSNEPRAPGSSEVPLDSRMDFLDGVDDAAAAVVSNADETLSSNEPRVRGISEVPLDSRMVSLDGVDGGAAAATAAVDDADDERLPADSPSAAGEEDSEELALREDEPEPVPPSEVQAEMDTSQAVGGDESKPPTSGDDIPVDPLPAAEEEDEEEEEEDVEEAAAPLEEDGFEGEAPVDPADVSDDIDAGRDQDEDEELPPVEEDEEPPEPAAGGIDEAASSEGDDAVETLEAPAELQISEEEPVGASPMMPDAPAARPEARRKNRLPSDVSAW